MGSEKMLPPGQMVDVGGFRLHALVCGQGAPTVIFEPALNGFALQYTHLQSAISAETRALTYDRAGQGWSDASPNPRTPAHLAGELNTLLARLGLQPPYILVGHSFGGLLVRVYAGCYPQEVAGVALIDSPHVDEYAPFPDVDRVVRQMAGMVRLQKQAARLGLGSLLARLSLGPAAKALSRADLETFAAVASQPRHLDTMLAEFAQHRCFFGPQSAVPPTLGSTPLVVITAGSSVSGRAKIAGAISGDEMNALHQKLQRDLVRLSTRSEHIIIPGATHLSILFQPEQAALVAAAIRRLVEMARAHP